MLDDLWNDDDARNMGEPELLRYRSNLLGADLAVTNFGGGNTSAKVKADDPLTGHETTVLWVKGSGGDLGSTGLDGFATLYLDKLLALERLYRGREHEDEMVGHLNAMINGWANYFCLGAINKPYRAVTRHAERRLRRWLRGKHRMQNAGSSRYPIQLLHSELGLVDLNRRPSKFPCAKA